MMARTFGNDDLRNLQSTTTRQYSILVHLLTVKSVTETAHHFETSQPAVSRLLAEMRLRFCDGLLVSSGERMVITDRGRAIRAELSAILDRLSCLIETTDSFEPEAADVTFTLGFADSNMVSLIPLLVGAITGSAAKIKLQLRTLDASLDVVRALENRDLDAVVDCVTKHTRDSYETLRYSSLGTDDVVLLARKDHAVIASPPQTSAEYLALKHVAPYPVASFELGPIDGTLRALKSARHISCFIPEYSLIPNVLIGSDLVFTTCRRFAEDYAKHLPLAVVPAPDFFPKMEFRMLWHEVTQSNPATIWLRRQIQSAAKAGNFEF